MNDQRQKIINQLSETETRWFVFLAKLEERMQELANTAIPELENLYKTDEDQFKRTYGRMLSGIVGQLNSIEDKAREVEHKNIYSTLEKIEDLIEDLDDDYLGELHDVASERCRTRRAEFEKRLTTSIEKVKETGVEDYEIKYQAIIDEYDAIKSQFFCKQCGSSIFIDKIYFITTHISCPSCQTQNTFVPSSRASELDHVGLCLAEQRTKHILVAHESEQERERELYYQIHNFTIEKIGFEINKNEAKIIELDAKIAKLEIQRKECVKRIPMLYKEYLKAKFEEWKNLVPELADQNQKIYESWLAHS